MMDLSPRQNAILALLVAGKTNLQIACDLNISDKTVKNHVSAIFEWLEVSSRTEAISKVLGAEIEALRAQIEQCTCRESGRAA